MVVVGILLGKGDARWLIPIGLVIVAIGNYSMSLMNLEISPWQAAHGRGAGAGRWAVLHFALNVAAFKYISQAPRRGGRACWPCSAAGGSVGTSMAQTIQERLAEQFHFARLNEHLTPLNPLLESAAARRFSSWPCTGDPAAARRHMTLRP